MGSVDRLALVELIEREAAKLSQRGRELWERLAMANFDRVKQLVAAHRFPGGEAIARDDLPDATQEAFLRVISMGAGFRESALGQFRAALRSCVANACLDFGRKQLRHERHAAGSLDERYDPEGEAAGSGPLAVGVPGVVDGYFAPPRESAGQATERATRATA